MRTKSDGQAICGAILRLPTLSANEHSEEQDVIGFGRLHVKPPSPTSSLIIPALPVRLQPCLTPRPPCASARPPPSAPALQSVPAPPSVLAPSDPFGSPLSSRPPSGAPRAAVSPLLARLVPRRILSAQVYPCPVPALAPQPIRLLSLALLACLPRRACTSYGQDHRRLMQAHLCWREETPRA